MKELFLKHRKKLLVAFIAALVAVGYLSQDARDAALNLLDKLPGISAVSSDTAPVDSSQ